MRKPLVLFLWLLSATLLLAGACSAQPVDVEIVEVGTSDGSDLIDIAVAVCNPEYLKVEVFETDAEVLIAATALNPTDEDCALSRLQQLDEPVGDRVVRMRTTGEVIPVVLNDHE